MLCERDNSSWIRLDASGQHSVQSMLLCKVFLWIFQSHHTAPVLRLLIWLRCVDVWFWTKLDFLFWVSTFQSVDFAHWLNTKSNLLFYGGKELYSVSSCADMLPFYPCIWKAQFEKWIPSMSFVTFQQKNYLGIVWSFMSPICVRDN